MLKVENIEVFNIKGAFRGMRNAKASWDKADSVFNPNGNLLSLGENDKKLAQSLVLAGHPSHSKFMRQILFSCDIIAPDYWWKEMDTYKVATVANSTSTMHKLTSKLLTIDDFSFDEITDYEENLINDLNILIDAYKYLSNDDNSKKKIWRKLIQTLPMSFNYTRTWTASYETLRNIYFARRNHKLSEWHTFCEMIEDLPLGKELITLEKEKIND